MKSDSTTETAAADQLEPATAAAKYTMHAGSRERRATKALTSKCFRAAGEISPGLIKTAVRHGGKRAASVGDQ